MTVLGSLYELPESFFQGLQAEGTGPTQGATAEPPLTTIDGRAIACEQCVSELHCEMMHLDLIYLHFLVLISIILCGFD